MKGLKRIAAVACGAVIAAASLGALAGCSSGGANTYEIWLYNGIDTAYYSDYSENPVLNYLMKSQWNDNDLDFEFIVPPSGTQQDNYQRMIASGDFPTLMQDSVADPAPTMYENGYILDLTEYVEEYMPNYYALLQENETLRAKTVFEVDGEERILSINTVYESVPYMTYGGMCYRRDWIVKYGQNPSTGASFSGGYTDSEDVDSWEDNVVFPSWYDSEKKQAALAINPDWDGTDPFYISDWEWMFEIFTEAQTQLGITGSYSVSMYYPGYTWAGGLCSCFGEGGIVWYADSDMQVQFGGTSDSTRAYFTCLNTWYENGWLDSSFNTRTSDAFYQIDSTSVRSGKVGMWCGVGGDLGGRIDLEDGGYTDGIFVAGCTWPVNDVYGDSTCQYIQPRVLNVQTTTVGTGFFAMKGAESKDLASLFTFLDYLFTDEGAALCTVGLNADQLAEEDTDTSFYEEYDLMDGAYTTGDDGKLIVNEVITNDSGDLSGAASMNKFPCSYLVDSIDYGYAETYEDSLKTWIQYENTGRIWGSTAYLNASADDSATMSTALTKVLNYMESNAYKFIKGLSASSSYWDITDDSDWATWCNALARYNVDDISELIQPYVDLYGVVE